MDETPIQPMTNAYNLLVPTGQSDQPEQELQNASADCRHTTGLPEEMELEIIASDESLEQQQEMEL